MSKIIDFKCTYNNSVGISKEAIQQTGLKFPEAYKNWDSMVQLAIAIKEQDEKMHCELPFCHTLEGEALGGKINYGDENIGPRGKDYICKTSEEILSLPEIDYSKGRISETLKACKHLREKGEEVVLYISGPFTIMNVLANPTHIFKIFRKSPETMQKILDKLQKEILRFVIEAKNSGVNMISYGDSVGGLNILGPKLLERVVEMFTYPLFKRMEEILDDETLVLLCPKTSFALLGTEKAVWQDIDLGAEVGYVQGCVQVIGKVKFVGQMCIKNKKFKLSNGIIKGIRLT